MEIKLGLVDKGRFIFDLFDYFPTDFPGYKMTLYARNGIELQNEIKHKAELPDIILIDVANHVMSGYEITVWLKKHYPTIKLIAYFLDEKNLSIIKMLESGCCSYLSKMSGFDKYKKTFSNVMSRGFYNPDTVDFDLNKLFRFKNSERININQQEQQFLDAACTDLTYDEIIARLAITEKTAERYIKSLFKKFGVETRKGLCLEASRKVILSTEKDRA